MQARTLLLPVLAFGAMAAQAQTAGAQTQAGTAGRQAPKKAAPKTAAQAAEKPNVVFFMCDQMSAMALPIYGNNFLKTPNIDRMARETIVAYEMFHKNFAPFVTLRKPQQKTTEENSKGE